MTILTNFLAVNNDLSLRQKALLFGFLGLYRLLKLLGFSAFDCVDAIASVTHIEGLEGVRELEIAAESLKNQGK